MRPILLIACLALLAGCQFKGEAARERRVKLGGWPYRPVAIRIHPFTRMTTHGTTAALDARVELVDLEGDTTKGVGTLRFELYADRSEGAGSGQARRIYQWPASIESLEDNASHWDPVTRTYRFELLMDRVPRTERLGLYVQFDAPSGERLTADARVEPAPDRGE